MKNIFVTGGGGYIGSCLVPKLLDKGYAVTVLDRFFFGEERLQANPQLTIIKDDSRRYDTQILRGMDAVIDLVAISNDPSGELFQISTLQINHQSRVNTALAAKEMGVKRYILPSSCSLYGFQENNVKATEEHPTNPLTTYAKANEKAELGVLPLADKNFTAVVMRQATVFGYAPRMRFDLAINGMVCGAIQTGKLPLLRDGTQCRAFLHVQDTTDLMCILLEADPAKINGQIFNVGSDRNNYQLLTLAEEVRDTLPIDVKIEWYGEPDHRSYRVNFDKVEKTLGWQASRTAKDGALEVYDKIKNGGLTKTTDTITLAWYEELAKWNQFFAQTHINQTKLKEEQTQFWQKTIENVRLYDGIVEIKDA